MTTFHLHARHLLGLAALAGASLFSGLSAAQDCQADADCGAGYRCELSDIGACTSPACPPGGGACPEPSCETQIVGHCLNAPCTSDVECPDPMVCHAETHDECSGGMAAPACRPGVECADEEGPPPAPPVCRQVTVSSCRQPYELPCTIDADCGPGFLCKEQIDRWCRGSAGVGPDGVMVGLEESCGEERTGRFACELIEQACSSDAECAAGLKCLEAGNQATPACAGPASNPAVGDVATPAMLPAPAPLPGCDLPAPSSAKACFPPHFHSLAASSWAGMPGSAEPSKGESTAGEASPSEPPAAPGDGVSRPTTVQADSEQDDAEGLAEVVPSASQGGCSLAGTAGQGAGALSWLLVIAATFGLGSRRRRVR